MKNPIIVFFQPMNQTTNSLHQLRLPQSFCLNQSTRPQTKHINSAPQPHRFTTPLPPPITISKAIIPTNKSKMHSKTIKNTTPSHSFHSPHRSSSSPSLHSDNTGEAPDRPSLVPPPRSPGRTCVAWAETWVFVAAKRLFRTRHCHIYMKSDMQSDKVV